MRESGSLIIVSAPSGAGKTSLINALLQEEARVMSSISHTTRPMRKGEVSGVNYHFVSEREFDEMIEQDIFLESAQVFGYKYGTSRQWVHKTLQNEIDVLLEIDWQGAQQIRKVIPDVISVFILPPSVGALEQRLTDRAEDEPHTINRRMSEARDEISHYNEYDYLIVNDNFAVALHSLRVVLLSARLRKSRQEVANAELLSGLVKI